MAPNTFPKLLFSCLSLLTFLLPCITCVYVKVDQVKDGAEAEGMFVFGSSLVDNGNNNFLHGSLARADYLPYGIDFPLGPSGRFTNGKNVIDCLGEQLKLPHQIPVFANPFTKGLMIVNGVNFASGGSGILDDTGSAVGHVINLNQQIQNFEEVTLPELEAQKGHRSIDLLRNYLFVVGSGGNDYTLNYFRGNSNASVQVFTANLITKLSSQLKKLYSLGGRKFVLISVYPIGCTPVAKAYRSHRVGCVQGLNRAAQLFNAGLKSLVDGLKPQMPNSTLVYVNSYKTIRKIVKDPAAKGFSDATKPCCKVGVDGILCTRGAWSCAHRNTQVFFDGLHPTEAVNAQIASKAYASNATTEVYPINVMQLAKL